MRRLRKMGFKRLDVIGLATEQPEGYLLRAMRAGCNDFFAKPLETGRLRESLFDLQRAQAAEAAGRTHDQGCVLSVYGVKGGVGATTLAVHLAHELVRDHGKRVLLIDDHYELGHVALHLGMTDGEYHFSELVRNVSRLDADLLKGMVAKHSSGMEVLTSPDACSSPYPTTADDVQTIFEFLRRQYDYVIVDKLRRCGARDPAGER